METSSLTNTLSNTVQGQVCSSRNAVNLCAVKSNLFPSYYRRHNNPPKAHTFQKYFLPYNKIAM